MGCRSLWLSLSLLILGGACVGTIGDLGARGGGDQTPAPTTTPRPTPPGPDKGDPVGLPNKGPMGCQESAPPISPVRRLTGREYGATVQDLLGGMTGVAPALAALFPKDEQGEEVFDAASTLIVTSAWAESAMKASEQAAKTAMANVAAIVPCKPEAGDEACAQKFIDSFGKRAFRRPLLAPEQTGLLAVYREGSAEGFAAGIELVIEAMLQSPSFLYRLELGEPAAAGSGGGAVKLTPHEVAARLSYTLWGSMPDQQLTAAADGGHLATADEVAAQARRLLADPRAHANLIAFHDRWLGLAGLDEAMKDQQKYPQFDQSLSTSMRSELDRMFEEVLFAGDGRMETLLTSRAGFVDAGLAALYGVKAPATGFTRVELDPAQRTGILSRAGIISAHTFADGSAPIHRGLFVRDRLLCDPPPNPPANLMVVAPEPPPNVSNREALAAHRADPSCNTCHELMDPIGFGFGSYDGIGRWRTTDGGRPVDDGGSISQSKDVDGTFHGVAELAAKLGASAQVSECVMATVIGFVQGPDVADDACVLEKTRTAFAAGKHDLRELVVAITRTDGFQYRKALAGEMQP